MLALKAGYKEFEMGPLLINLLSIDYSINHSEKLFASVQLHSNVHSKSKDKKGPISNSLYPAFRANIWNGIFLSNTVWIFPLVSSFFLCWKSQSANEKILCLVIDWADGMIWFDLWCVQFCSKNWCTFGFLKWWQKWNSNCSACWLVSGQKMWNFLCFIDFLSDW